MPKYTISITQRIHQTKTDLEVEADSLEEAMEQVVGQIDRGEMSWGEEQHQLAFHKIERVDEPLVTIRIDEGGNSWWNNDWAFLEHNGDSYTVTDDDIAAAEVIRLYDIQWDSKRKDLPREVLADSQYDDEEKSRIEAIDNVAEHYGAGIVDCKFQVEKA